MSANHHYDVIIIGTGAGGGTLAYRMAPSGKKILLLERGDFVPREKQNCHLSEAGLGHVLLKSYAPLSKTVWGEVEIRLQILVRL